MADGVLSVFAQLITMTHHRLLFGNINIQSSFYNTLWCPIMLPQLREARRCSSSYHCPIRRTQTEITSLCHLSHQTNSEAKRNAFNNLPWKVVNIDWFVLCFICNLVPLRSKSSTARNTWPRWQMHISGLIVKCNICTIINKARNKTEGQLLKHWLLKKHKHTSPLSQCLWYPSIHQWIEMCLHLLWTTKLFPCLIFVKTGTYACLMHNLFKVCLNTDYLATPTRLSVSVVIAAAGCKRTD